MGKYHWNNAHASWSSVSSLLAKLGRFSKSCHYKSHPGITMEWHTHKIYIYSMGKWSSQIETTCYLDSHYDNTEFSNFYVAEKKNHQAFVIKNQC